MDGARAVARDAASVEPCAVPFVPTEFVRWENIVERFHDPVPDDLGDDGCGRDREDRPVTVDNAFVRHGERELPGVDEGEVGPHIQLANSPFQRADIRDLDPFAVDGVRADDFGRPGDCLSSDSGKVLLPLPRREEFRIADAFDPETGRQNDRSGHHGASERSATGFVRAGNSGKALPPQRLFASGGRGGHTFPVYVRFGLGENPRLAVRRRGAVYCRYGHHRRKAASPV